MCETTTNGDSAKIEGFASELMLEFGKARVFHLKHPEEEYHEGRMHGIIEVKELVEKHFGVSITVDGVRVVE